MNDSRTRPAGVAVIAFIFLALAILALGIAARYVLLPGGTQALILLFTRLQWPVTLINLLAIPALLSAGFATLIFRGLWQGRMWGWAAAVFFSFLGMLGTLAVLAFFLAFSYHSPQTVGLTTLLFFLSALIFIYLLKTPPLPPPSPVMRPAAPAAQPPQAIAAAAVQVEPIPPSGRVPYATLHHAPTVALDPTPAPRPPKSPLACLFVLEGPEKGQRFDLYQTSVLIGRHPLQADIHLTDPTVSAEHARLFWDAETCWIEDLASTNGVYVRQHRVQKAPLQEGDIIQLGDTRLIFSRTCDPS